MVRLAVVVEGLTEVAFVDQLFAAHLLDYGVYATPTSLGGRITVERLASRMAELFWSFDVVTSLVDYYGFENRGDYSVGELEERIRTAALSEIGRPIDESRIVPYVQRHEFEGLLFSQVSAFGSVPGAERSALGQLQSIRAQFATPEDINDNPNTAPSKRISWVLPDYNKRVNGPQVAQAIGLPTIRRECPRFNQWLTRLESLAT